jgi:hypothetical protein
MSFVHNLFGTIAGNSVLTKVPGNIGYIPVDGSGKTIQVKGELANPSWLGLKNRMVQKYAYEYCYPVAAVVNRLAEYDITGTIEILRSTGKGKDNFATNSWATNMNRLLAQPNPLQSWEQFRGQQVIYKKVFGFCPVLPLVPSSMTPDNATSLINIPPWLFEPVGTKKLLYTSKVEEIVQEWKVTILGKSFTLKPDQVFILEDSFLQDEDSDFILPQSKLVGLDMAVSNICAAMEADNVLLKKKGPLGVWSHDAAATKDSVAGYLPMNDVEKRELQNDLSGYGLTWAQYQWMVSRQAIKWNPVSFDVRQLGTKETIVSGEKAICHCFGFPYVLYEEIDATFANSNTAAKAVYQTNVIPNNTKDLNKYNKFFKADENACKITNNYSHIAALQEDALAQAQAAKSWNDALLIEYNNNLITKNQWLTARGYDAIGPEGDKYKKDEEVTTPLLVKDPTLKINEEAA